MRVAVTGLGVVSPLGQSAAAAFANCRLGVSAIKRLDLPGSPTIPAGRRLQSPVAATVAFRGDNYFEPPRLRMLDRTSQFALVAASQAMADARLGAGSAECASARAGVFVGTGMGGFKASTTATRPCTPSNPTASSPS